MSYLIDTNVISELAKPKPDGKVIRWLESVPDEALHLSVLSLGELRKGVELLPDSKRAETLRVWLEHDVRRWFEDRLLPITEGIAERWGRLLAQTRRPVPAIDGLLAATALHSELRLVTRNDRDFQFPGLAILNPWEA